MPNDSYKDRLTYSTSLCHDCVACRYVRTKTSTFLLCGVGPKKYPAQPVRTCAWYQPRADASTSSDGDV